VAASVSGRPPCYAGVGASVRLSCQGGERSNRCEVVTHVAEGYCVVARRGGKQPEANE
jgi:hypothetical protein